MSKYKKFNKLVFLLAISVLFIIGIFNLVIDPYGVWNIVSIYKINASKTDKEPHERFFKAIDIMKLKPKTIFIGTSRTRIGLDPEFFQENIKEPAYNLAVASANAHEMLRYFQHTLKNQPNLRRVVIGIDIYSFNKFLTDRPGFDDNLMEQKSITIKNAINVLWTADAFKSSIKTLKNNFTEPDFKDFNHNGKSSEMYLERTYVNVKNISYFTHINENNLNDPEVYARYSLSPDLLNDFRSVVLTCKERNIDFKVFISPSHVTDCEAIRAAGLWPIFEQLKIELSKITPVWDFSGYNSITTEPISDHMKNYWDSSHYRKGIGNLILMRLFNIHSDSVPEDFGVLLTTNNLNQHLRKVRKDRELWANQNIALVKYIQNLRHKS